MESSYNALSICLGLAAGIASFTATLKHGKKEKLLFSPSYLKWLCLTILLCIVTPALYYLRLPNRMSLFDAYLLQVWSVGVANVVMVYSLLAGLLLGALVVAIKRQGMKAKSRGA